MKLPCFKAFGCGKSWKKQYPSSLKLDLHAFSLTSKGLVLGIWNQGSGWRSAGHQPPEDRGSCLQWPLWTPMQTSGRAAGRFQWIPSHVKFPWAILRPKNGRHYDPILSLALGFVLGPYPYRGEWQNQSFEFHFLGLETLGWWSNP
jgi:hypothetical protein